MPIKLEKLPSTRIVFLFGDIDHELTLTTINSLIILDEQKKEKIILCICSDGGDYELCMSIYDTIKMCKSSVCGVVYGKAYSSASMILQACSKRFMTKNSLLLLHDGEVKIERETQNQYKSDCKFYDKTFKNMYDIYCKRSKLNKDSIKHTCQNDTYFDAEEALKVGLIDKILTKWDEAF